MMWETLFIYFFLTILGLVLGSFYNVVIFRLVNNKSIAFPSSYCPNCQHPLQVRDLVPLLSYILLGGKCRYCKQAVSRRYPLVETFSALILLTCFTYFGFSPPFFKYAFALSLLLIISFIDIENQLIPNKLVIALFIWVILWQLFYPSLHPGNAAAGFLVGGGIFLLIVLLSRGGMGGGDVKLMAVLGFAAGWPHVLLVFLAAFMLGAAVGIVLMLTGKKTRKDPLAFGPFISFSFFLVTFWGSGLWHWYSSWL